MKGKKSKNEKKKFYIILALSGYIHVHVLYCIWVVAVTSSFTVQVQVGCCAVFPCTEWYVCATAMCHCRSKERRSRKRKRKDDGTGWLPSSQESGASSQPEESEQAMVRLGVPGALGFTVMACIRATTAWVPTWLPKGDSQGNPPA